MPTPPCYICGVADGKTKDHVFPRCLFTPPLPQDMITAPACAACQQQIQPDEEVFRNFAAAGSYADETARELWEGKVARSFDNSPGLRTTFVNAIKTMEWKSPGGVILGDLTVVEGDQERIGNVLRKIVRGLFYLDSGGQVMSDDVKYRIDQVSPAHLAMPDAVMKVIDGMPLRTVGDVVRYKFQLRDEEPRLIISWMAFYRMMFVVSVRPDDLELPLAGGEPEA